MKGVSDGHRVARGAWPGEGDLGGLGAHVLLVWISFDHPAPFCNVLLAPQTRLPC